MEINTTEIDLTGNDLLDPHLWVDRYADYLYTYAFVRINNEDVARDLVQETFLAALERKEKFEGRSTEKTWLTAIGQQYQSTSLLRQQFKRSENFNLVFKQHRVMKLSTAIVVEFFSAFFTDNSFLCSLSRSSCR